MKCSRSVQPCRAVACLMLAMHAEESIFNVAMDAAALGYLLKEDDMDRVLLGLQTIPAGGVYRSPVISAWLLRRQQRSRVNHFGAEAFCVRLFDIYFCGSFGR